MNRETEKYPVKNHNTIATRILGEEAMVAHLGSSSFYNLNPVGTFIWERCDGRHSIQDIGAALAAEYPVTLQEAVADSLEFIQGLVAEGLLSLADEPEGEAEG